MNLAHRAHLWDCFLTYVTIDTKRCAADSSRFPQDYHILPSSTALRAARSHQSILNKLLSQDDPSVPKLRAHSYYDEEREALLRCGLILTKVKATPCMA
jgi:hypothetical protein